jgi:hypothetical protein
MQNLNVKKRGESRRGGHLERRRGFGEKEGIGEGNE